jgi:L-ascorbate metabolism protein UlaG (beta-lactamase superfamily)
MSPSRCVLIASLALVSCSSDATSGTSGSAAPPASSPRLAASSAAPAASASEKPKAAADPKPEVVDTKSGPWTFHAVHHGTVWFEAGGKVVWVDPFSEGDLSGPKADLVLITDIHADHYDPKGLAAVTKDGSRVIGPQVVADKDSGVVVMKNGETRDEGPFKISAIPMYNLTRGPEPGKLFHDKGRGNGYVIAFADKRVYFSGDTECTDEMKALKDIDLAFVCMNLPYTMPPSEAAQCISAFKPKVLVPYHYRGSNLADLDAPLASSGVAIHPHAFY